MSLTNFVSSNPLITIGIATTAGVVTGYFVATLRTKAKWTTIFTSTKSYESADPRVQYTAEHSLRLLPVQEKLKAETMKHSLAAMMGAPEIAQLLQNLIRLMNAKKVIEVGVFTGYSTLAFALALPPDGKVVGLDVSIDDINIGRPFWKEAGVDHKITAKVKPAVESLDELIARGETGTYDLAFIDADKENYDNYFEKCLKLLRKGGVIAIDNVLWCGSVMEANPKRRGAVEIKRLNAKLKDDSRIGISMLTVGDGLTLAFKL